MHNIEFLTQALGKKVSSPDGSSAGEIRDLLARGDEGTVLPSVVAALVGRGRDERWVPIDTLSSVGAGLRLPPDTPDFALIDGDVRLKRDVLDRQIVDTQDFRVVRVSDVRLAPAPGGGLVVVGVDPGQSAVLRRLLPATWGDRLVRALGLKESVIAWSDVEPTADTEHGVLRLRTSRDSLKELHPADIADIVEQMRPADRAALIESLDVETAADVVTETQDDIRQEIMERLPVETAADILEEMEPDDAADVVGDLSGAKRKELLDEMDEDDADDVRELLTYDENTAGGLMTTEFVSLALEITAEDAIARLRELAPRAETIYYVYVVNDDQRLAGVISLRDLIVASPTSPLWNVMVESVVRVGVDAPLEEVASALEHYDLLAVPVVDSSDRLLGIVTVDDTLEELLPPSWRRQRFRRR